MPGARDFRQGVQTMEWLQDDRAASHNPIDLLEELVRANEWTFERPTETELMVEVEGRWCGYYLLFIWRVDVGAICFSCHFDQKIPAKSWPEVYQLIGRNNEALWLGHFDLTSDEFILAFFLAGTDVTLPVYLWSQLRFPQKLPGVLALGATILTVTFFLSRRPQPPLCLSRRPRRAGGRRHAERRTLGRRHRSDRSAGLAQLSRRRGRAAVGRMTALAGRKFGQSWPASALTERGRRS